MTKICTRSQNEHHYSVSQTHSNFLKICMGPECGQGDCSQQDKPWLRGPRREKAAERPAKPRYTGHTAKQELSLRNLGQTSTKVWEKAQL